MKTIKTSLRMLIAYMYDYYYKHIINNLKDNIKVNRSGL